MDGSRTNSTWRLLASGSRIEFASRGIGALRITVNSYAMGIDSQGLVGAVASRNAPATLSSWCHFTA